jgi:hypothetical protein
MVLKFEGLNIFANNNFIPKLFTANPDFIHLKI